MTSERGGAGGTLWHRPAWEQTRSCTGWRGRAGIRAGAWWAAVGGDGRNTWGPAGNRGEVRGAQRAVCRREEFPEAGWPDKRF